jgi:prepilin peptidase CpaA
MTMQFAIALFVGLAASVEDLVRRRISNWIPVAACVAGFLCLAWEGGWRGALSSLGGAVGGFGVFLIFYWLGGIGGGDVKLMAGLGAVLGVERLVAAALWTAACGGVLAAGCVTVAAIRNVFVRKPAPAGAAESIPYAPAIALGAWLALWLRT